MTTLNLNQATKLYYGSTEVQKLFKGNISLFPLETDPYYNNVVLYLKGDEQNIVDSSLNPNTINKFGNIAVSNANKKYGNSSIYFNGIDNFLSINETQNFDFLANNFTVEFWIFPLSLNFIILDSRPQETLGSYLTINIDQGIMGVYVGSSYLFQDTTAINLNSWNHVSVSRNSNNFYLFVNGNLKAQVVNSVSFVNNFFKIGKSSYHPINQFMCNGYIDSFRITKNICRYTANFNPETDTYLS